MKKDLFNKISNDENITIEEYIPIMKMILSKEEFYIVCKMNNIKLDNNDYEYHFEILDTLSDRSRLYKEKQLSIIENRAIKKLIEAYKINNSYYLNKEDLNNYYEEEINKIDNNIQMVENIKRGEEMNIELYQFPFSILRFHENNSITYDRREYFLKQLYFCKDYYKNKIDILNVKTKELK